MRYLRPFNESSDTNNRYYELLDIIQDHLDDLSISPIPDSDDAESYLSDENGYPECWGFHKNDNEVSGPDKFKATSGKANFDIESIGIWNLSSAEYKRLENLIQGESDRIKDALGYIKIKQDIIHDSAYDMYITLISEDVYQAQQFENKIKSADEKINSFDIYSLSDDNKEKAVELINQLYKLV